MINILVGLSGWWTPFPHDDEKAKKYVFRLILNEIKDQTLRLETPQYKKIKVGDTLQLWWKKRGQPAKKNQFYGEAICTNKFHVFIDVDDEKIWGYGLDTDRVSTPRSKNRLNEAALKVFCKRDMNRRSKEFFRLLRLYDYKSGQYVVIRWMLTHAIRRLVFLPIK